MAHYLDPKNDLVFKRIFGEHKNLCMSLLNSMLPLEENQQVVAIEYQTSELLPELGLLRNTIVDVRCRDNHGRQYIVEMQMYWTKSFQSRVLLNASKAYVLQLDKADRYELLQPVYALSFVNDVFENSPEYYHHYKIVNIKDTEKQIKGLEFVFIELPKFRPQNMAERKLHELWLRFLTEIRGCTEQISPELLENKDICEAVKYTEIAAYTKEQLFAYDKVRDAQMTERSALSDMREKGIAEGIEKGIEKGRAEGEQNTKTQIARNLLKKSISVEEISEITGLTVSEIQNIR
jgi:predicted transposase/invertase (TIGR01784 family)